MPKDSIQPNFVSRPGGRPELFRGKPEKLNDAKGTLKRLLKYLTSKRRVLIFVFLLAFSTTVINIIGTRLCGYTIDKFISNKDIEGLAHICLIMLSIYLIGVLSMYSQNILMVKVAQKISADIRRDLFNSIQKLPLKYFDTHSSGDLMSRLTNDVDNINTTLSQSVTQLFSGVINIIGMLIAMMLLNPFLTLIGLISTPLMFIVTKLIAKKTQPYFVRQQRELGNLNGFIEETISGQKAILLFSREEYVKKEFSDINHRLTKSSIVAQCFSGTMGPINNFFNNLTYLIIAVCGGYFILKGFNNITVGIIFTLLLYMRNFTRPINDILNLINTIQSAIAGAERVFEVMNEEKEADTLESQDIGEISGNVSIENVNFSYIKGNPVLKNACIEAQNGQTIAIVGPTGAGKTTIINLLTKFYDIDGGHIIIDGKDIISITRSSLRKQISMVLQDTYLFSENIRENIRYGRLDATDKEVEEAAVIADAYPFIMQLPNGFDSVLSDNGGNLSQGQRQLIAIARAVLAKSSILILDEATSSIDTRTEIIIQNAMIKLMKGKTSFVIAHRLSTIRNADKIIVVNEGQVVEQGTHFELIEKQGFYAGLYNSQFKTGMAL